MLLFHVLFTSYRLLQVQSSWRTTLDSLPPSLTITTCPRAQARHTPFTTMKTVLASRTIEIPEGGKFLYSYSTFNAFINAICLGSFPHRIWFHSWGWNQRSRRHCEGTPWIPYPRLQEHQYGSSKSRSQGNPRWLVVRYPQATCMRAHRVLSHR